MKKSVVFDFPDDFMFPQYFRAGTFGSPSPCDECYFIAGDEDPYCFLTGDNERGKRREKCPFCEGEDTVNYN